MTPATTAPQSQQRVPALRLLPSKNRHTIHGPLHSETSELPPPPDPTVVRKLALLVYETLENKRSIEHLGTWPTTEVLREIRIRRSLRQSRNSLTQQGGASTHLPVLLPGPAHLHQPAQDALEAAVTLFSTDRAVAVALRFELVNERWKLAKIGVL